MNKLRTLFAVSVVVAATAAACGDHVTVPPDKTGACVAGLLQKCGDSCVDLQTDLANCGACGTACNTGKGEICSNGKCAQACPQNSTKCGDSCVDTNVDPANCGKCGTACGPSQICAIGTCAGDCESLGYLTCQGAMTKIDAGPDGSIPASCVDPKNDRDNCGKCGNACGPMESCTKGTCCPTGRVSCGGVCTEVRSDPSNCGVCGLKCPANAPVCVYGSCTKCNPKVLVLADSQTGVNQNMKTVMTNAGFDVTVVDSGALTYAGTPAATDFGAVVLFPGANFSTADLPMAGGQALVAAQAAGVGIVVDGFDVWEVWQNRYQSIKSLMLYQTSTNYYLGGTVYQDAMHPVWTNVAPSFGIANQTLWMQSVLINNGTQIGHFVTSSNVTVPAVAVRATPGGRIVNLGYAIDYQAGANQWTNDGQMQNWFNSAVRWVTNCSN